MADEVVETTEAEAPEDVHNPKINIMPEDQGEGVGPHFPSGTNTVEAAKAGALDISGNPVDVEGGEAAAERATLKSGDDDDDDAEKGDAGYDPGDDSIDKVLAYVESHPDEADRVLAAEKAGKNRSTLVSQLEAR